MTKKTKRYAVLTREDADAITRALHSAEALRRDGSGFVLEDDVDPEFLSWGSQLLIEIGPQPARARVEQIVGHRVPVLEVPGG